MICSLICFCIFWLFHGYMLIILFFFLGSIDIHFVTIFYGGEFVCGEKGYEKKYVNGKKVKFKVNIEKMVSYEDVMDALKSITRDKIGNREVVRVHIRQPHMSLAYGLLLLCEGTFHRLIELLKNNLKIELYFEQSVAYSSKNVTRETVKVDQAVEESIGQGSGEGVDQQDGVE